MRSRDELREWNKKKLDMIERELLKENSLHLKEDGELVPFTINKMGAIESSYGGDEEVFRYVYSNIFLFKSHDELITLFDALWNAFFDHLLETDLRMYVKEDGSVKDDYQRDYDYWLSEGVVVFDEYFAEMDEYVYYRFMNS